MKKRLFTLFLAICMVCTLLPFGAFAETAGLGVTYHSREDVLNYLKNTDFTVTGSVSYKEEPNYDAPYSAGVLSDSTKENAIKVLNIIRYIAGLDPVTWDSGSEKGTQAAADVNFVNGSIDHYPSQPEGMDDALYQLGYNYCGQSNIAMGYKNLESAIINGWMADDDSSNIDRIGHRRWCLNPAMGKTSFGAVISDGTAYARPSYAMYAFDRSNTSATQTTVAWPAQIMPIEFFNADYPWSVTIGKTLDKSTVKVTLTKDDGTTWNFSGSSTDGDFYVNNDGYGKPGCIIFRPNDVEPYQDGDVYTVKITGIPQPLEYTVTFISMCAANGHRLRDPWWEGEPTCEDEGWKRYICDVCGNTVEKVIPALGHDYNTYKVTTKPTTGAKGELTGTCSRCDKTVTVTLPKLNKTDYTYKVTKAATCTETGTASYTWKTTDYGTFKFTATLPKIDHSYTTKVTKPTCTKQGYTTYTCTACGDSYKDNYVAAKGHSWDAGKVTTKATCTANGVKTYTCTVCGATKTESIAALNHSYKNGVCTRCGAKAPNPFVDVKKDNYCYDPVLWAYYHDPQITSGMDATHFVPNGDCTRGQIVTFLWRANGCPEVEGIKNPFKDVSKDAFYYKAVLWAVKNGITNGVDDTHFAPNATCTRGQAVTFLWRADDEPTAAITKCPFKDVSKTAFYYKAMMWAVGENITNGVDKTHFAPNNTCTRGQIVTFLYRDMT